jgi:hypothetical protein
MRLDEVEARARLAVHDHGVLCTMHPERGVDAVPAVYAVTADGHVGIPIDQVKPKASLQLQREHNLAADPRATLLIDQWDATDWTQLWWVRAQLEWCVEQHARSDELADLLVAKYAQYADRPFANMLVMRIVGLQGWAAATT